MYYVINKKKDGVSSYYVKTGPSGSTFWTDNIGQAFPFGTVGECASFAVHELKSVKGELTVEQVTLDIEHVLTVENA